MNEYFNSYYFNSIIRLYLYIFLKGLKAAVFKLFFMKTLIFSRHVLVAENGIVVHANDLSGS
jgi:hypothetical protein